MSHTLTGDEGGTMKRHPIPYAALDGKTYLTEAENVAYEQGQADARADALSKRRGVYQCQGCGRQTLNPERDMLELKLQGYQSCCPERRMVQRMTAFQLGVADWMLRCFGFEIAADKLERNHRFIEEALELVQARGMAKADALALVEYVYGRPAGDIKQEIGGVMVTLAALCNTDEISLETEAEIELARVWGKIDAIRQKQATKPKGPLPEKSYG